jgi:hypothetical protein
MDKKPLIVEGVPAEFPEYIGQMAVDTVGRRAFISYDLSDRGWQLIASAEGGGGLTYWTDILGKPDTFAPAAHTHDEYLTPAEADLLYLPIGTETGGGAPAEHTHEMTEIIGLTDALEGKADNADLTGYAPANHVHAWDTITDKPNTFTPAAHTHLMGEIEGLTIALDGKADNADLAAKADTGHTHTVANITDFAAGVAANIPAEYLTAAEGDAAYQPKGDYLTAVPAEYLTEAEGAVIFQAKGDYLTAVPEEYLTQAEGDARYAIKGTDGGTIAAAWGDIAGTLSNQADLQAALNAKADDADLAAKADATHTHTAAQITDFAAAVGGAIPAEYVTTTEGDARYLQAVPAEYLTEAEGDTKYKAIDAPIEPHTHTAANITDFPAAVAANIPAEYLTEAEAGAAYQPKGNYLTAIPAEYLTETEGDARYMAAGTAPAAHTHDWADITGEPTTLAGYGITDGASDQDLIDQANWQNSEIARLETDIAGKAETTHTHTAANITDFTAAVAANIPAEYVTEAEGDARYMAAGAAPTAHTHTAAQITDFAAGVAANIPAAYMTDAETAAAYQPKGTYLTAVPVMTGAQIGGAMVGNGLAQISNYLAVKTGAGLGIAADNSLQVQTVNTTPAPVKFWTGTAAAYTAITTKDANTLYFVTG